MVRERQSIELSVVGPRAPDPHRCVRRVLPEGYDTPVGPRGARLSGGPREWLALARALLTDAPIVTLDEATGALDLATEADVLRKLRTRLADRTVLVVAHRLSTIRQAGRIAVLYQCQGDTPMVRSAAHGDPTVALV